MSSVLIKNGYIVTASESFEGDLYIQGEKIIAIGKDLNYPAQKLIDASGKYIFPGGIDAHVHMNVPCADGSFSAGYDSETLAAATGGTTTILDYVLQEKGLSMIESVNKAREKAEGHAAIDYGFHVIVTNPEAETIKEISELVKQGITSYKLFMANDLALTDKELLKFMEELKQNSCLACVHAENKDIILYLQELHAKEGKLEPFFHSQSRPILTELEAINRVLSLVEVTNCPTLIAHVSIQKGVEFIKGRNDLPLFVESCPHYLILNEEKYVLGEFESAKAVISPPLRSKAESEQLWSGAIGNGIDIISSDHNGFNFSTHKQLGKEDYRKIPNGGPGLEQRFSLMLHHGNEKGMSLNRFVELVSTNPAKLFGLYPQKGTLAPGSDADIVIFDPNKEQIISASTQAQASDYTPYEGFVLKGAISLVFSRGEMIVENGKFCGKPGRGQYLSRKTFSR